MSDWQARLAEAMEARGLWIDYAKQLAGDLRRIKNDPAFSGSPEMPKKRSRV